MAKSKIVQRGKKFFNLGTSNTSFLRVALDLRSLGIDNYMFMLEIIDLTLINVNPHAKDKRTGRSILSQDQIGRIITECTRNPWYFLREVVRVPDPGGVAVPYEANRGNIAQAWCIWRGYDSWLCLPRQKGKTMSALCFQLWMFDFGTTNSSFIFVNKELEDSKKNLDRFKKLIDFMPEYLHFEYIIEEDGSKTKATMNATTVRHPVNKNEIVVKSKATSYEKALSLARGLTAPIIHFDEPEFTEHIKTIVANSVSTFEEAARRAKANHAMYGRIFTCTPRPQTGGEY